MASSSVNIYRKTRTVQIEQDAVCRISGLINSFSHPLPLVRAVQWCVAEFMVSTSDLINSLSHPLPLALAVQWCVAEFMVSTSVLIHSLSHPLPLVSGRNVQRQPAIKRPREECHCSHAWKQFKQSQTVTPNSMVGGGQTCGLELCHRTA